MQRYWKWVFAGGIVLGSMISISVAPPMAHAGSRSTSAAVMRGDDDCPKYDCYLKDKNGEWQYVKSYDNKPDAMAWFKEKTKMGKHAKVVAES